MSLRGKMVGICLTAALVAPTLPAQAAELELGWPDWAAAVWEEVLDLLPPPPSEPSTGTQCEPPGDPHAAPCIEPGG